jgi:hypothetical protein
MALPNHHACSIPPAQRQQRKAEACGATCPGVAQGAFHGDRQVEAQAGREGQ